jgi:hypothetical protein
MAFPYRRNIKEQNVEKGEPVDSGISSTGFPTDDFKDKFVARFKDVTQDPNKKSFGVFSNEDAEEFAKSKLPTFDNAPNFGDEQSNLRAQDFLNKYRATFIIPDEEKASAESTLGYISGDPNSNLKGSFPGGMEVS